FIYFTFFFQAEDGIRVFHVTGVQTCALPIYRGTHRSGAGEPRQAKSLFAGDRGRPRPEPGQSTGVVAGRQKTRRPEGTAGQKWRSEERRVRKDYQNSQTF